MGFRIESLGELNTSASRIEERIETMSEKSNSACSSLDTIISAVGGNGIEKDLELLKSAISDNVTKINEVLSNVSNFISSQTAEYNANESELASQLQQAQAELDSIDFS